MSRGAKKPRPRNSGSTTASGLRLSVPVASSAAGLASGKRLLRDGPLVNYAAPWSILSPFDVLANQFSAIFLHCVTSSRALRQNYLENYDIIILRIFRASARVASGAPPRQAASPD